MNDAEFQLFEGFEDDQWWFVGKRLLVRALLGDRAPSGRLLDLGCGIGGLLREFEATARPLDSRPVGTCQRSRSTTSMNHAVIMARTNRSWCKSRAARQG